MAWMYDFGVMAWATRQDQLPYREQLVLIKLALYVNGTDMSTTVGQETLAKRCNMGVRTLRRSLDDLEKAGLITRERRNIEFRRTSDRIRVHMDKGTKRPLPEDANMASSEQANMAGERESGTKRESEDRNASVPEGFCWDDAEPLDLEPETSEQPTPKRKRRTNGEAYAFAGKVLKLNRQHYDQWAAEFDTLDLQSELQRIDHKFEGMRWADEKAFRKPSQAFFMAKGWLRKEHEKRAVRGW